MCYFHTICIYDIFRTANYSLHSVLLRILLVHSLSLHPLCSILGETCEIISVVMIATAPPQRTDVRSVLLIAETASALVRLGEL